MLCGIFSSITEVVLYSVLCLLIIIIKIWLSSTKSRKVEYLESTFRFFLLSFLIIAAIIIIVFNDIPNSEVASSTEGPQICFDFPRNFNWVGSSYNSLLTFFQHKQRLVCSDYKYLYKNIFLFTMLSVCCFGLFGFNCFALPPNKTILQKNLNFKQFWKYFTELNHKPEPEVWPPSNGIFIQQLKCDIRILQD